ncbi:MAG: transposase [Gemmatimonadetes bacterium]|nr:transposase [Gemmatimonadota bacterium]NNM07431.1 transposase [Gemmatimonadota bacterium]
MICATLPMVIVDFFLLFPPVREVSKGLGISEHTYYRWRREYGGMNTTQAKKLKELEKENQHLKRAVANLTVDNLILKEAAKGNF